MKGIEIVQPEEVPLTVARCLASCGTVYRGCDPQCPKRWYEHGLDEGYKTAQDRVRSNMDDECTP